MTITVTPDQANYLAAILSGRLEQLQGEIQVAAGAFAALQSAAKNEKENKNEKSVPVSGPAVVGA